MIGMLPSITALLCVTVIEIIALSHGVNGHGLSTSMLLVGGIVGYECKRQYDKRGK